MSDKKDKSRQDAENPAHRVTPNPDEVKRVPKGPAATESQGRKRPEGLPVDPTKKGPHGVASVGVDVTKSAD